MKIIFYISNKRKLYLVHHCVLESLLTQSSGSLIQQEDRGELWAEVRRPPGEHTVCKLCSFLLVCYVDLCPAPPTPLPPQLWWRHHGTHIQTDQYFYSNCFGIWIRSIVPSSWMLLKNLGHGNLMVIGSPDAVVIRVDKKLHGAFKRHLRRS